MTKWHIYTEDLCSNGKKIVVQSLKVTICKKVKKMFTSYFKKLMILKNIYKQVLLVRQLYKNIQLRRLFLLTTNLKKINYLIQNIRSVIKSASVEGVLINFIKLYKII